VPQPIHFNNLQCQTTLTAITGAKGIFLICQTGNRNAQALIRAGGNCEYSGKQGFEMANGNIYLETHHIVPLS
jgi:hypothetical protein